MLLRTCNLLKCCWGYVICLSLVVEWVGVTQVVVLKVWLGCKEYPYSVPLTCVYRCACWVPSGLVLIPTSTIFCRLLAQNFAIYSLLFRGFSGICEISVCHLSRPSYSCLWFCLTWKTKSFETCVFYFILVLTLEACTRDNQVLGIF